MRWLTDNSRLEKLSQANKWLMLDNELFLDKDNSIYITPRNYMTDNYTIPDCLAGLAGNKSKYDVRPSHIHDFICTWHQAIKVNLTEQELIDKGFLKQHKNKIICEDIPIKYLECVNFTKWSADCLFKRAMKATGAIPPCIYNLYRFGVFFNIGWSVGYHPPFDLYEIYEEVL